MSPFSTSTTASVINRVKSMPFRSSIDEAGNTAKNENSGLAPIRDPREAVSSTTINWPKSLPIPTQKTSQNF